MKDFFKFTLATVTGLILTGIIIFLIGLVTLFGIISSSTSSGETEVKKNSIMMLNLNGTLKEHIQRQDLAEIMRFLNQDETNTYGLDDILASIKKAKENTNIKGIYIKAGSLNTSYASIEAIRNALLDFKKSGKFIITYSDNYTQGLYYLSSVADKVILNPKGMLEWYGLSTSTVYYTNMLKKVGIEMQIFKVGTYKSAVETFTSTKMSPANREQLTACLGSIWGQVVSDVSKSRHIAPQKLNELADKMLMFYPSEESVKCGLADTLIYQNDVRDYIKKKMDIDKDDHLNILGLDDMINIKKNVPKDKSGNILAIYYASGDITDQPSSSISDDGIVGSTMVKDLRRLKEDKNVKAVVLRINSPGGSAFASEQIWHAIKELKEKKPVIVSMGDYAASGGYYISCIADTIIAEPNTITGSIGIFGMIPNISGLTQKIGVNFDEVKTNKFSRFGNITRPLTEEEKALFQMNINENYETFIDRCAEGRHKTADAIKKIAQGHIWSGTTAKKLGLVDMIGGMNLAVNVAAQKAGIKNYTTISYPKPESLLTTLTKEAPDNYIKAHLLKNQLGSFYDEFMLLNNIKNRNTIQARLPFGLNIK
ncbi:MAG: signal peptide peptidase SppA [Bacteroidaceae bacterium]